MLARVGDVGLHVSASANAGNYAPKVFAKRPDAAGINKRQFESAMHALLAAETLHVVEYGKPSDKTRKLAIKLAETDTETDTGEGGDGRDGPEKSQ